MNRDRQWIALGVFLATCFAVATLGAMVTGPAVRDWYPTLAKPAWTPPAWLFGPVWTALYAMMALAGWMTWRLRRWSAALGWFAVQLLLNATWSPLFFGGRMIGAAVVNIVLLWFAIARTTIAFWRITPVAGWLLLPYLIWVTYAAALNMAIWRLNS